MIMQVESELYLLELEHAVRDTLGAHCTDVCVLLSKPYIDLKRLLLDMIDTKRQPDLPGGFCFCCCAVWKPDSSEA